MRIFKLFILAQFIISINVMAINNEFYFKKPGNWIEKKTYDKSINFTSEEQKVGGIYLLVDFQSNILLNEKYKHFVIKINNEAGIQDYSDIWISYDPAYQKLLFHELVIYRDGETFNRLKKDDFKIVQNESELDKKIYNGTYSAGTFIEDIKAGDILEYSFTIAGENPLFAGNHFDMVFFQYGVPIKKMIYSLLSSNQQKVFYKTFNTNFEPVKTEIGGKTILKWEQSDIKEIVINSQLPSWYTPYPAIQISTYKSWNEVIEWGKKLFPSLNLRNSLLEAELNQKIKDLTSKEDKINTIIRFVQDEIRYVGIEVSEYSYKPRNPNEVYQKRYGDCKEKSYLLSTLLNYIGVESDLAYVSTHLKSKISDYLPSPTVFNHVIVAIKYNGKNYFIDPTITSQRGNFKNMYNGNYQKALLLNSEYSEPAGFQINSNEKIVIQEMYNIQDSITPVKYMVRSTHFGGEADKIRSMLKSSSIKELENTYINFYSSYYPSMKFTSDLQYSDDELQNSIETIENYEIPSFWHYDSTSKVNDFVSFIIAHNLKNYISNPEEKNRKMPFYLYYPIEIENNIKFNNSKAIGIAEKTGELKNPNFHFKYAIKQFDSKTISLWFNYKSLKDHVDTMEMKKYFQDLKEIDDLTYYEFTWGKEESQKSNVNWIMLIMTIFLVIILCFIANKLYKRDINIETVVEPLPIGGWLILPIIGIFLTPVIIIYQLIDVNFFNLTAWKFISSQESVGYNVNWSIVYIFELFTNCIFLVYSIFLIVLAVKRRTIFPLHYIAFRILNFSLILIDYILSSQINSVYFTHENLETKELVKSFLGLCIWVPYMIYSYRVKDTFAIKYAKDPSNSNENLNSINIEKVN